MCDAVAWLREFQENVANEEFLRERVNLPCWIHLSEARLDRLLALIDRKTGRVGVAKQGWPRVVANYSGTVRGDCLFGVLQLGLSDEAYADDVLDVVIELVSRPPQRVYVEPLLEETLFMLKCKESPKLAILEYYLSYKWSIDRGLVKWEDAQKEYNDFVLEFQKGVYEIAPDSELVTASVSMLSSIEFVEESCAKLGDREFELVKEMVGIARDEDRVMSTMALFRALSGPVDQRQNLKGQYIPVALPPADVLVPRLGRFAYSLEDAAVRLFLSKRYDIARDVVELIESVCANLNQSNEVRYDSRAVPMRLRPVGVSVEGYPQNTCVSVAYDHVFLNYGFHPFEKGDICFLVNISSKDVLAIEVLQNLSEGNILAHILQENLETTDFQVVVKPEQPLMKELKRIMTIPAIVNGLAIDHTGIVSGFLGLEVGSPAITVVEGSFIGSYAIDVAEWLGSEAVSNGKTLLLARNSQEIDKVLVHLNRLVRIPLFEIVRLDLSADLYLERVMMARSKLLSDLGKQDPSLGISCASALNYIKLRHKERADLIRMLEILRPLEYIEDAEKRMDCLKRSAKIVCCLIDSFSQAQSNFHNVVVVDTNTVDDIDMLNILNMTNPRQLRVYGDGSCAFRLRQMPETVVHHCAIRSYEPKCSEIEQYLGYTSGDQISSPGVASPLHNWTCSSIDAASETAIASAFVLTMLGYNSLAIVCEPGLYTKLLQIIKMRGSWSPDLLITNKLMTLQEFLAAGITEDAVILIARCDPKLVAGLARKVFWQCSVSDTSNLEPCLIALNEAIDEELPNPRQTFPLPTFQHLLALCYSMQLQKQTT